MQTQTLTEEQLKVVLRRIRKYASEFAEDHSDWSSNKCLAEAVRWLELETY